MPRSCPGSMSRHPLIAAACAAVLCWPALVNAEQASLSAAERLRQIEQQLESHHQKIEASHLAALNLEQELHRIDSEIAKSLDTLGGLQEKLRRQEEAINQKESEISQLVTEKDRYAAHIKKRLAGFYQSGEVGVINALFSATDLGDLLNLQEYVQALFQHDKRVLGEYRTKITLLAQAKEGLATARAELLRLIGQVEEGEKALRASREERDSLLAQARTEADLHRQATQALQEAAAKLTTAIEQQRARELKAAKQASARLAMQGKPAPSTDTGFAANKGRLPLPALGRIVRTFGPYQDPFGNELRSDGIDLDVPPETEVAAMYSGRVIFADEMPGYGAMIIIDHGGQYYTLLSGLASLAKTKDDLVAGGDVIGVFGQFNGLINPGLHIEIRHGSTPEDPLPWLDTSLLETVR